MRRRRRWTPSLRRRDSGPWPNWQVAIAIGVMTVILGTMATVVIARYARASNRAMAIFGVPWDPSWPALPVMSVAETLSDELARSVYALVGRHANVVQHMPCYCGCRSEGHTNAMQCYIKRRTADGRIIEWHPHGRVCPMGADIAVDAVLWHQDGASLEHVRADIEQEYSSRGPGTPTPPVPAH